MQYKKLFIFLVIQWVCIFDLKAQNLDSLLRQLNNHKEEDTTRLNLLNSISFAYSNIDQDKGVDAASNAIALAQKLNDKRKLAIAFKNYGMNYESKNDYPKAIAYYQKVVYLYEELDDKKGMQNILGSLGYTYYRLTNFPKAVEYFQKSIRINELINNAKGLAEDFAGLGLVYLSISDYAKALEYHQKALRIWEQLGNKSGIGYNLVCIGRVHKNLADYPKSFEFYKRALNILQQVADTFEIISAMEGLGKVSHTLSNYETALTYYQHALRLSVQIRHNEGIYVSLEGLGTTWPYLSDKTLIQNGEDPSKRIDKTLEYLGESLRISIENKVLHFQSSSWKNLSNFYEAQKDYPKALEAYKNFITIRDSIVNDKKKKQITQLEFQYEFNKKEDSLKLQQKITDGKLRQQVMLAKQQQQQLELNKKELDLSNKEKDLQRLAYLKTQADLQNEQLEKKDKEKQLTLSEKEKQLQLVKVKTLTQEKKLNSLNQQQQWIYIVGGAVLLGFVATWFFYRARLQQVRLKTEIAAERIEQQQKETEFQRRLGDISLSALRSQMNPHFIFNCLNSIKLYTTQNDTAAASEYLTKFSRLIRLVLENSRNERITLDSELDALRLYIEMEAMRFKEKLKYNISVEKDVDLNYIEIPPLLLQPYVENAIWHGLMQKEEGGKIDIAVAMEDNESILAIDIIDNGIGRAKAAELKSKTATKHKSHGMKVTSERLALINQVYKTGANVTIHDITDNYGQPSGTRVTIKVPIE